MRTSRAKIVMMLLLAISLVFSLISCGVKGEKGDVGDKGDVGQNGKSAYELAVENGYVGTLEEWLASLVGEKGSIGASGEPGIEGAAGVTPKLQINDETNMWEVSYDEGVTWQSLNVLATGAAGVPGVTPKLQINGETNMWEVSYDEGVTWQSLNVPATGAAGAPGAPGVPGESGEPGTPGKTPKLQINGETNMWEVSYDEGVTWQSLNVSATGAAGAPGEPGTPGTTPKLQINGETNMWEVSYDGGMTWESLGVPATGTSGVPGTPGESGESGTTPELQINRETNMWEVSYDGGVTWESLGVLATGTPGAPGIPGQPGESGIGIADAYVNSSYHLILILSDGSKIDAGYVGVSQEPLPDIVFTVTFTDFDGTVLEIQTVKSGEDATPPEPPERDGYVFGGWDGTYTSVSADCTVVATYISTVPRFTVTFIDHDGAVLSRQVVYSGESATPPINPIREGYAFAGWVGTYTDVLADYTVIATYTAQTAVPAVVINECVVKRGDLAVITVAIFKNPGIASLKLTLEFDDAVLMLDRVVYNTEIGGQALFPQNKQSPLTLNWFDGTGNATGDFVFATLYFEISDTASTGDYTIVANYHADDVYNIEENNVDLTVISGKITVTE